MLKKFQYDRGIVKVLNFDYGISKLEHAGSAAGFLIVGLSKEKAITTGFGIHIVIFIVCALISFFCWVTPQKQKNPSPSAP